MKTESVLRAENGRCQDPHPNLTHQKHTLTIVHRVSQVYPVRYGCQKSEAVHTNLMIRGLFGGYG